MDNPIPGSSNAEVANKGVRTSETFVQTRKRDLIDSVDESTLSTSTDTNCHEGTNSSGSIEQDYYRLRAGSRLKFQGKSPSVSIALILIVHKIRMSRFSEVRISIDQNC